MKTLIITGQLAAESIRHFTAQISLDVEIRVLPISVAAFLTPHDIIQALHNQLPKDIKMILVPGMMRGNVKQIEDAIGIPTFKGPSHTSELPFILSRINEIQLSKTQSASEFLGSMIQKQNKSIFESVQRDTRKLLREQGGLLLGRTKTPLPIGSAFPLRVMAEIVNAPDLTLEQVRNRAVYFVNQGADIIDLGMLARDPHPEIIHDLIETVRSAVHVPISIDTLDPHEIKIAVDAGIDLILSIDRGNLSQVANYVTDTPVVILPTNLAAGIVPPTADERVIILMETIRKARDLKITQLIADPILEPAIQPGLFNSLRAYWLYRQRDQTTPVLFGLGNVTELLDIDSPGVNGLLTALAMELKTNLLFIPEHSVKAQGSIRETVIAAKMMFLAQHRKAPPKDLGIDLLILKEKRWTEDPPVPIEPAVELIDGIPTDEYVSDARGWFRIQIDRPHQLIMAIHYPLGSGSPDLIIRGSTVAEVYKSMLQKKLVHELEHAAYLGKELEKAALALKLHRSYVQDQPLFP